MWVPRGESEEKEPPFPVTWEVWEQAPGRWHFLCWFEGPRNPIHPSIVSVGDPGAQGAKRQQSLVRGVGTLWRKVSILAPLSLPSPKFAYTVVSKWME